MRRARPCRPCSRAPPARRSCPSRRRPCCARTRPPRPSCTDTHGGAAHAHVLADGGDHLLDVVVDRCALAREGRGQQLRQVALGLRRQRGDGPHHVLELLVAGDEIGFRVHLDDGPDLVLGGERRSGPRPPRGRPSWRPSTGPSCAASRRPASMSPLVSVSAVLQSIMPAPVLSRRAFTMLAVTAVISGSSRTCTLACGKRCARRAAGVGQRLRPLPPRPASWPRRSSPSAAMRPCSLSARSSASAMSGLEIGDLPEVVDAKIVETLLELVVDVGQTLEIVGIAARRLDALERRHVHGQHLLGGASDAPRSAPAAPGPARCRRWPPAR